MDGDEHPDQERAHHHEEVEHASGLDDPEGDRVDHEPAQEVEGDGGHDAHRGQCPRTDRVGEGHPGGEETDGDGGQASQQERVAGSSEILGEEPALEIDGAGEVDRHVAGADAFAERADAPEPDGAEEALGEPDVGGQLVAGVPAELAPGLIDCGQQHRRPEEPEHEVGRQSGQHRQPVLGLALEPGPHQPSVHAQHSTGR